MKRRLQWNEAVDRKFIVIVEFILRFWRSKREGAGEVVRKEKQVGQALRVRIVLVIGTVGERIVEIASFC